MKLSFINYAHCGLRLAIEALPTLSIISIITSLHYVDVTRCETLRITHLSDAMISTQPEEQQAA